MPIAKKIQEWGAKAQREQPPPNEKHEAWKERNRERYWASVRNRGEQSASGLEDNGFGYEPRDRNFGRSTVIYDTRDQDDENRSYLGRDMSREDGDNRRFNRGSHSAQSGDDITRARDRDNREGRASGRGRAFGREGYTSPALHTRRGTASDRYGGGGRDRGGGGNDRSDRGSDRDGPRRRRPYRTGDNDWKTPNRGMDMYQYSHSVKARRMAYANVSDESHETESSGESQEPPNANSHLTSAQRDIWPRA